MSKIHIPTPLRQYVGKQSTVDVKAATVAEAMTSLVEQHPDAVLVYATIADHRKVIETASRHGVSRI